MNKNYLEPEINVIRFEYEEIMTEGGVVVSGPGPVPGGGTVVPDPTDPWDDF